MSLKEAYRLAHSAECRLQMEASRPERNLRFLVGHLMHYENLRLRIVEIEHDVSRSERAKAVQFKGTGHVDGQRRPSTGQLGRKSPPPPVCTTYDDDDDEDEDDEDDDDPWSGGEDEEDSGLSLQRFPSGSARPPQHPPDLEPDLVDDDDDDDDPEPVSPEEPDEETLQRLLQTEASPDLTAMYEGVRHCRCHKNQDAPSIEKMWELPPDKGAKDGITRAVAQVAA